MGFKENIEALKPIWLVNNFNNNNNALLYY